MEPHRLGEEIALKPVGPEIGKDVGLLARLHAFRCHPHFQGQPDFNDGAQQPNAFGAMCDRADKAPVDLQAISSKSRRPIPG